MKGNLLTTTTDLARHLTLPYIYVGDTVIDATCGNGNDTLWLAKAVGPSGHVEAFDIQPQAIRNTEELLQMNGITYVTLHKESFTEMAKYCEENSLSAVLFNLGYLPGGDKEISTDAENSLQGISIALQLIRVGGIVTIMLYNGHSEGTREKSAILEWAESLDSSVFHVIYVQMKNQHRHPPEILCITKKTVCVSAFFNINLLKKVQWLQK